MSRSIGDRIARSVGVIWEPEIEVKKLTQKYNILVLGSDGIFDCMTNDQIAEIVWEDRNKPANEVAQRIVELSVQKWKEKENIIDDCTWIVIYMSL